MKKPIAIAALLLLTALALSACGSSSSSSTSGETAGGSSQPAGASESEEGGGSIVPISTPSGAELAFEQSSATAKAGQVSIEFENPQALKHNVAIEDSSGKVVGETALVAEGKATATVKLKPGTYHFFCTVPGHRQAGMEGTLTVK